VVEIDISSSGKRKSSIFERNWDFFHPANTIGYIFGIPLVWGMILKFQSIEKVQILIFKRIFILITSTHIDAFEYFFLDLR
jgi:hypothetical protein